MKGVHQRPQMSYVYPEEPEHGHTLCIECNEGEQGILLNAVLSHLVGRVNYRFRIRD